MAKSFKVQSFGNSQFSGQDLVLLAFLCKILDFVSFLARTISLLSSLGKFLSSPVSWEDQLFFLRRFLATSFSFSRFSWQDLRLFQFFGKIPNFLARSYTCWIVWQCLILPEFHGKILEFFSFLPILIKHLHFSAESYPLPFPGKINFTFWVSWQDPILVRFFHDKILDFFSVLEDLTLFGKILDFLAKPCTSCVFWQGPRLFGFLG